MSAVVEFLLARIGEDEATAEAVITATNESPRWWVDGPAQKSRKWWVYATGEKFEHEPVAQHIAAHDPARVLAECEAKRRIVAQVVPECDPGCIHPPFDAHWIVRELAAVYADHPDYRPEWRP